MSRLVRVLMASGLLLAIGACGSPTTPTAAAPSSTPSVSAPASPTATPSSTPPSLVVADSRYGKILIDAGGRTLYLFTADREADSTCYNACATTWPPLLVSASPTAGPGLTQSLVAVGVRTDNTRQIVYNGHPLYTYVGDRTPGEIKCQAAVEFGGGWFVVDVQGNQILTP